MPREPRHPRCARCIKQRKQCDAGKPQCGLCTIMKKADCIYPEGMPSRREFLEMEARREARQRKQRGSDKIEMDVDHHAPRGSQYITNTASGQGPSSYGQSPPALLNASIRGGHGQHSTFADHSRGPTSNTIPMSASTIPFTAQPGRRFTEHVIHTTTESQDLHQQHPPYFSHNASSFGTNSKNQRSMSYDGSPQSQPCSPYTSRQSLNLNDAFSSDPPSEGNNTQDISQPTHTQYPAALLQALDTEPQSLSLNPEQIGIHLANALEANSPRHIGGIFDGLSDWTGYVNEVNTMSVEDLKAVDVEGELKRIQRALLGAMEG